MNVHDNKSFRSSPEVHPTGLGLLGLGRQGSKILKALNQLAPAVRVRVGRRSGPTSYLEVISDPEIQAIVIALPNHLHFESIVAALRSGKDVLCEKPLALTVEQTATIAKVADENGKIVCEAFSYRFHPQHQAIAAILRSGELGEIRLLEGHYRYQLTDKLDIRAQPLCGGGALNDAGCYLLNWACELLEEEPLSIGGIAITDPESGIDTSANLTLGFKRRAAAQLSCSMDLPRESYLKVIGTSGSLYVAKPFHVPAGSKCSLEMNLAAGGKKIISCEAVDQLSIMLEAFLKSCTTRSVDPRFSHWQATVNRLELARIAVSRI